MKRNKLLKSPVYWTTELQMELYRQIEDFMKKNNINKTQLADYLGCSKGYVTQLLAGDYDHKLSKFMELSLAIGKIPQFEFLDADVFIEREEKTYKGVVLNKNFTYVSSSCINNSDVLHAA